MTCQRCHGLLRTYGYRHPDDGLVWWCPNPECIAAKQPIYRIIRHDQDLRRNHV